MFVPRFGLRPGVIRVGGSRQVEFAEAVDGNLVEKGGAVGVDAFGDFGAPVSDELGAEQAGRLARYTRFVTYVMVGIPTIVTGAFIYAIWRNMVSALWLLRYRGWNRPGADYASADHPIGRRNAAARTQRDPRSIHRARNHASAHHHLSSLADRSAGIITGIMLAVARAMGETAPLLLTALGNDLFTELNPDKRMSTLSPQIFRNAITIQSHSGPSLGRRSDPHRVGFAMYPGGQAQRTTSAVSQRRSYPRDPLTLNQRVRVSKSRRRPLNRVWVGDISRQPYSRHDGSFVLRRLCGIAVAVSHRCARSRSSGLRIHAGVL
jgi:hypothetical protein